MKMVKYIQKLDFGISREPESKATGRFMSKACLNARQNGAYSQKSEEAATSLEI